MISRHLLLLQAIFPAFLVVLAALSAAYAVTAEQVSSPDGTITATVAVDKELKWSLTVDGKEILPSAPVALKLFKGATLGEKPKLTDVRRESIDEMIEPPVAEKRRQIPNKANQMTLVFDGGYALTFRAYDDGIAWRFETSIPGDITVESETVAFRLNGPWTVWRTSTRKWNCSFESEYTVQPPAEWPPEEKAFLPLYASLQDGPALLITEADLLSYPGMFLGRDEKDPNLLLGQFAPYPKVEKPYRDRYIHVAEAEPFIAKTAGTRTFPWRVVCVARKDTDLLLNDMVYRLATPCQLTDTSWIRPGKVAWDWWHANVMWNVPFKSGINNDTYKKYIDFAAANGLEYVILDEGWSKTTDLTALSPEINLEELARYGKEKGVGLILWCVWKTLDAQKDQVLPWFRDIGIAGVKVDFMDRDDQKVVEFYERMARATAEHHLLLDFHGAFKPTGLRRTWPNLITREGVVGMENTKWSDKSSPDYTTAIPFIRMVAGPMDYTPGAMRNAQKAAFKPIFDLPFSQGTRVHQLALYVVFESPLQMLSDSPSAYEKEPECLSYIARCPTTWDDTVGLDGKVGSHVVVARRHGDRWWLGGLTNWDARDLTIPLHFLSGGQWEVELFTDGPNADRAAQDFVREVRKVTAADTLNVHLAPGGGVAAAFAPVR